MDSLNEEKLEPNSPKKNTITINFPLNYNQHIRRRCVEGVVSDVHCHLALWLEWYGIYLQSDYNWKYPSHFTKRNESDWLFQWTQMHYSPWTATELSKVLSSAIFYVRWICKQSDKQTLAIRFRNKNRVIVYCVYFERLRMKNRFFLYKMSLEVIFSMKQCWFNKFTQKTPNNDSKVYIIRFYRRKKRFKHEFAFIHPTFWKNPIFTIFSLILS